MTELEQLQRKFAQRQIERIREQLRAVQTACASLRNEVVALNAQLGMSDAWAQKQQDVAISKPTTPTTIGADGRYE